jgi:hypothetical protein
MLDGRLKVSGSIEFRFFQNACYYDFVISDIACVRQLGRFSDLNCDRRVVFDVKQFDVVNCLRDWSILARTNPAVHDAGRLFEQVSPKKSA